MELHFYKYQGTGNDFIMIDNRGLSFPKNDVNLIHNLCDRRFGIGADGLILLEPSIKEDFTMVYFNADANEGSMCGNGGRCLVAFAKQLQIIDTETTFEAVDGLHFATIENDIVSLKMIDVEQVEVHDFHAFLNTGSPHDIRFCNDVKSINRIINPISYRFIGSIFERHVSAQCRNNFCTQNLHSLHIRSLSIHI